MTICWSTFWLLFGQHYDYVLVNILTIVWSNLWLWFGHNYDYVGRSFDQTSTPVSKLRPSFDQTSTKLRPLGVEVWSNLNMCWSNFWICVGQPYDYCLVTILIICWSSIWLLLGQTYDCVLIKIMTCCWSTLWLLLFNNLTICVYHPHETTVVFFKKYHIFRICILVRILTKSENIRFWYIV